MYAHYNTRARTPRRLVAENARASACDAFYCTGRINALDRARVRASQNKRGNFFRNRLPLKWHS